MNYVNGLLGGDPNYFTLRGNLTGKLGLPKPHTRQEQLIYSTQEGITSMLTGGALGATAAGGKAIGLLGRGISEAPAVYTELARRGGAALAARNLEKTAKNTWEAANGIFVPMSSTPTSPWEQAGTASKRLYDLLKYTIER